MQWRVVEHANEPVEKFKMSQIKSNVKDKVHEGSPHFVKHKLRKERTAKISFLDASAGILFSFFFLFFFL
jgi:hypothetical protein